MVRRAAALLAALLAPAAAGCVTPQEGPPLHPPLLAETAREGGGEPIRWYLAEGGVLVEAIPVEPAAPSLGVELVPWSAEEKNLLHIDALREDGWGGGGGLVLGDDLHTLAGTRVEALPDVDAALAGSAPGDAVDAIVVDAASRTEKATRVLLGRKAELRRTKLPAFMEKRRTGLSFCLLDAETAARVYGTPEPRILLSRVLVGSPAWLAGLRRGDRVLALDTRAPKDAEEACKFVSGPPGTTALVEIETPGGPRRFEFLREEDVEASHGFSVPLLVGSAGDRRYWGSYLLGGILWSRVSTWWNVPEREPAYAAETGTLLWLVRVRSSPESATLYLFGIPIPLR